MTSNRDRQPERLFRPPVIIPLGGNALCDASGIRKDQQHPSQARSLCQRRLLDGYPMPHPVIWATPRAGDRLAVTRSRPVDPASPGRRPSARPPPVAR